MIVTIWFATIVLIITAMLITINIKGEFRELRLILKSIDHEIKDMVLSKTLKEIRENPNHCNPIPCSEQACKPVKPKGQRPFTRTDVDPTLWRAKFDAMLDDKAKTLKSDNKVFADHHIDRQRFKALATEEQKIRHAELQVLCKAKGREKIAETMGRGAKKKG